MPEGRDEIVDEIAGIHAELDNTRMVLALLIEFVSRFQPEILDILRAALEAPQALEGIEPSRSADAYQVGHERFVAALTAFLDAGTNGDNGHG